MTTEASVQYQDPIRQYLRLYIKDDEDLLEHVLITCFSSFTSNPLNLGVMAPTSEGKSYTISLVTALFKNAYVFTGSSPKAFFYEEGKMVDPETHEDLQGEADRMRARLDANEEDREARAKLRELTKKAMVRVSLEGRILVFLEPPEASLFEALKPILSHDKWESEYRTVEKGSDGRQRTTRILLAGWPTFIFASAKDQDTWAMWPELQSRCVIVSPNMHPDKYLHANELTSQLLGLPSFVLKEMFPPDLEQAAREEVDRIRQVMDRTGFLGSREGSGSKRDNFVINPFAGTLNGLFPHESGLRMRQFRSLLSYVNILAMIGSEGRATLVSRGQARAVVASLADVSRAASLVFSSTWAHIPRFKTDFYREVILEAWEAKSSVVVGKKTYSPLTVKEILAEARKQGTRLGPDTLRKKYLVPLEEAGVMSSEVDPDDKRGHVWTPIETAQNYRKLAEPVNFDLLSVKEALKAVQTGMGEIQSIYAYPDGRFPADLQELAEYLLTRPKGEEQPEEGARDEARDGGSGDAVASTTAATEAGPFSSPVQAGPAPQGPEMLPSPAKFICSCGVGFWYSKRKDGWSEFYRDHRAICGGDGMKHEAVPYYFDDEDKPEREEMQRRKEE